MSNVLLVIGAVVFFCGAAATATFSLRSAAALFDIARSNREDRRSYIALAVTLVGLALMLFTTWLS